MTTVGRTRYLTPSFKPIPDEEGTETESTWTTGLTA